jgi:peptidoglycan/xylan/chitin deacetylase (PgdA/CDA1 family)
MESQRSIEAMILTYHAVERDASPLAVSPALFREHVDRIAASGLPVLTVSQLAEQLRRRSLGRAVAITFDDGFASVVEDALPLLRERGLPATIFCVASRLGDWSDWPTDRAPGRRRRLADAAQLAAAAHDGFEIGAHGLTHRPLVTEDEELLWHELEGGREALEVAVGAQIRAFAYPYGASSGTARALVGSVYGAACTTELRAVRPDDSPHALPRIDAHYLRRPALLSRALEGSLDLYLRARRLGAVARRRFRPDYRLVGAAR